MLSSYHRCEVVKGVHKHYRSAPTVLQDSSLTFSEKQVALDGFLMGYTEIIRNGQGELDFVFVGNGPLGQNPFVEAKGSRYSASAHFTEQQMYLLMTRGGIVAYDQGVIRDYIGYPRGHQLLLYSAAVEDRSAAALYATRDIARRADRYADRKARGACPKHPGKPAVEGGVLCRKCIDYQVDYRADLKARGYVPRNPRIRLVQEPSS